LFHFLNKFLEVFWYWRCEHEDDGKEQHTSAKG